MAKMTPQVKQRIKQIRYGEVPKGYKRGRYNIIPDEWEEEVLRNLSDNITKGATPTTYGYTWAEKGVLFLKSDCVTEEGFVTKEPVYITEDAHQMMSRSAVRAGDILISITGYLGKVGVVPFGIQEANINQHIARVRPYIDRCNSRFVYYYLGMASLKRWFEMIQTGQAYPQLSLEQIRQIKIPMPPIIEQKRIVKVLESQDRIIELKEKIVEEKKRQKKSLMQQLFTKKKRLPGFSEDWKTTTLGMLLKERKTYSQKGLEYPHVTLSTEGIYAKTERYDRDHLVKSEDKEYKITHKGDICYNPANLKFGVICVNDFGDAIFSPIYVTFEIQKGVELNFLSNYLMRLDFINAVRKYEEGTVYERMAVKPEDFLKFEILLPPIEEQRAIADILTVADQEIVLLQKEIEQEKLKKKALMQLLLTGIVRV